MASAQRRLSLWRERERERKAPRPPTWLLAASEGSLVIKRLVPSRPRADLGSAEVGEATAEMAAR
eukprot:scaffold212158_cov23-Tisochrysis_lutea.AAC.1